MTDSPVSTALYIILPHLDLVQQRLGEPEENHGGPHQGFRRGTLTNFPMLYSVTDPNLRTVPNGGGMGNPMARICRSPPPTE